MEDKGGPPFKNIYFCIWSLQHMHGGTLPPEIRKLIFDWIRYIVVEHCFYTLKRAWSRLQVNAFDAVMKLQPGHTARINIPPRYGTTTVLCAMAVSLLRSGHHILVYCSAKRQANLCMSNVRDCIGEKSTITHLNLEVIKLANGGMLCIYPGSARRFGHDFEYVFLDNVEQRDQMLISKCSRVIIFSFD